MNVVPEVSIGSAEAGEIERLREKMVGELRDLSAIQSDSVAAALGRVPRHVFAPGESLDTVYAATRAIVTKRDARGAALSSVSEAHIQATMLEQAGIEPGMRVLEIGTGGYNAALIAELVGSTGEVTSVDIDPEIVDRARSLLATAGYDQVDVVLADAEHGLADRAPFDRVIVTAGAWDLPPVWADQLAKGGRIVVPLRMRGLTRSVAFEHENGHLTSRGYRLCGFVPMQGISSHSERILPIDEDRVTLQVDGTQQYDTSRLREALLGPRVERWGALYLGRGEPMHDLDLWISTVADNFGLLKAVRSVVDSGLTSKSTLYGAKTVLTDGSLAYRASARPVDTGQERFEFGVFGYGPDAERLAEEYAGHIREWDQHHRGGAGARIEVYSAATPDADLPPGRVIDKRHTRVVISWP